MVGALMLMLVTAVAVAAPGKGGTPKKDKIVTYSLFGIVSAVDESSVTVDVEKGNKAARDTFSGEPATFAVDSTTKVERNGEDADLSVIQAGDEVKVQSKAPESATSFTARQLHAEGPEPTPAP